jgi:hypothetical protein
MRPKNAPLVVWAGHDTDAAATTKRSIPSDQYPSALPDAVLAESQHLILILIAILLKMFFLRHRLRGTPPNVGSAPHE